jgi:hypothetical protein
MSFFGTKEDAKNYANQATKIIDEESTTSPVRDGGSDVGGAPIATNVPNAEFSQSRTRTGIQDHTKTMRRSYGLDHSSTPK